MAPKRSRARWAAGHRAGRLLLSAAAALLMLGGQAANAQGWYLEAHGGLSVNHDAEFSSPSSNFDIGYDQGAVFGVAVGYGWADNWRAEGEFTIRANTQSEPAAIAVSNGDAHIMSVIMANVFYDFDTESNWTPYIGGGIGIGTLDPSTTTVFIDGTPIIDADNTALDGFAYQIGAGVGYPLGRSVTATLDYRLLGAHVEREELGVKAEIDYLNSSFWLGLRFSF